MKTSLFLSLHFHALTTPFQRLACSLQHPHNAQPVLAIGRGWLPIAHAADEVVALTPQRLAEIDPRNQHVPGSLRQLKLAERIEFSE
jgi:hypothetical protein